MTNEKIRDGFKEWFFGFYGRSVFFDADGDPFISDYGRNGFHDWQLRAMTAWFSWKAAHKAAAPVDVEVPEFPELETIADLDYAHKMPKNGWDEDQFSIWQKLQVAQRNKMQLFTYAKKLKSIIESVKVVQIK